MRYFTFVFERLIDIDDPDSGSPLIRVTDETGFFMNTGVGDKVSKRSQGKYIYQSNNELKFNIENSVEPCFMIQIYFDEGDNCCTSYDGFGMLDFTSNDNSDFEETFVCELYIGGDKSLPVGEVHGRVTVSSGGGPADDDIMLKGVGEEIGADDDTMLKDVGEEIGADDDIMLKGVGEEIGADDDIMLKGVGEEIGADDDIMLKGVGEEIGADADHDMYGINEVAGGSIGSDALADRSLVLVSDHISSHVSQKSGNNIEAMNCETMLELPKWANEVCIDNNRGELIDLVRKELLPIADMKIVVNVKSVALVNGQNSPFIPGDSLPKLNLMLFPDHELLAGPTTFHAGGKYEQLHTKSGNDIIVFGEFSTVDGIKIKSYSLCFPVGLVRGQLFVKGRLPWLRLSLISPSRSQGSCPQLYGGLFLSSALLTKGSAAFDVVLKEVSCASASDIYAIVSLEMILPVGGVAPRLSIPRSVTEYCSASGADKSSELTLKLNLSGFFSNVGIHNGVDMVRGKVEFEARLLGGGSSFHRSGDRQLFCVPFSCGAFFSEKKRSNVESSCDASIYLPLPNSVDVIVNDLVEIQVTIQEEFADSGKTTKVPVLENVGEGRFSLNSYVSRMSLLSLLQQSRKSEKKTSRAGAKVVTPNKFACPMWRRVTAPSAEEVSVVGERLMTSRSAMLGRTHGYALRREHDCAPFVDEQTDFNLVGEYSISGAHSVNTTSEETSCWLSSYTFAQNIRNEIISSTRISLVDNQATKQKTDKKKPVVSTSVRTAAPTVDSAPNSIPGKRGKKLPLISSSGPTALMHSVSGILYCYIKGYIQNNTNHTVAADLSVPSISVCMHLNSGSVGNKERVDSHCASSGLEPIRSLPGCSAVVYDYVCKTHTMSWSASETSPPFISLEVMDFSSVGTVDLSPILADVSIRSQRNNATLKKTESSLDPYALCVPLVNELGDIHCWVVMGLSFLKLSVQQLVQYNRNQRTFVDKIKSNPTKEIVDSSWKSHTTEARRVSHSRKLTIFLSDAASIPLHLCSSGLVALRDYEALLYHYKMYINSSIEPKFILRFTSSSPFCDESSRPQSAEIWGSFKEGMKDNTENFDCASLDNLPFTWECKDTSLVVFQSAKCALSSTVFVQLLLSSGDPSNITLIGEAGVSLSLKDMEMGLPVNVVLPLRKPDGGRVLNVGLCFLRPGIDEVGDGKVEVDSDLLETSLSSKDASFRIHIDDGYVAGIDCKHSQPFFEFLFVSAGSFESVVADNNAGNKNVGRGVNAEFIDNWVKHSKVKTYRTPFLVLNSAGDIEGIVRKRCEDKNAVNRASWGGIFAAVDYADPSVEEQLGIGICGHVCSSKSFELLILCRDASKDDFPIVGFNYLPLSDLKPCLRSEISNNVEYYHGQGVWCHLLSSSSFDEDRSMGKIKISLSSCIMNSNQQYLEGFDGLRSKTLPGIGCLKLTFLALLENSNDRNSKGRHWGRNSSTDNETILRHIADQRNDENIVEVELEQVTISVLPLHGSTKAAELSSTINYVKGYCDSDDDSGQSTPSFSDGDSCCSGNMVVFPLSSSTSDIEFNLKTSRYRKVYVAGLNVQDDVLVGRTDGGSDNGTDRVASGPLILELPVHDVEPNSAGLLNGTKMWKRAPHMNHNLRLYVEVVFIPYISASLDIVVDEICLDKLESTHCALPRLPAMFSIPYSPSFAVSGSEICPSSAVLSSINCFDSYSSFQQRSLCSAPTITSDASGSLFGSFMDLNFRMNILPDAYVNNTQSLIPQDFADDGDINSSDGAYRDASKRLLVCGSVKISHLYYLALKMAMSPSSATEILSHRVEVDLFSCVMDNSVALFGSSKPRRQTLYPSVIGVGSVKLCLQMKVQSIPKFVAASITSLFQTSIYTTSKVRSELLLKQAFLAADLNNSGNISMDELLQVFEKYERFGQNYESLEDSNSTGGCGDYRIIIDAFARLSSNLNSNDSSKKTGKELIAILFDKLDIDGDGSITWWEWKIVLSSILRLSSGALLSLPNPSNDAVMLYMIAVHEHCQYALKWNDAQDQICSVLHHSNNQQAHLAKPYTDTTASHNFGKNVLLKGRYGSARSALNNTWSGGQLVSDECIADMRKNLNLSLTQGSDSSSISKLHAMIFQMRTANNVLGKKLETALVEAQKVNTNFANANPNGSAAPSWSPSSTFNIDGTMRIDSIGHQNFFSVGSDATMNALRKLRDTEQKSSIVEQALLDERKRAFELQCELETMKASSELLRSSRLQKSKDTVSTTSLLSEEIFRRNKELDRIAKAKKRKNEAGFLLATWFKIRVIPKFRKIFYLRSSKKVREWLLSRILRWKWLILSKRRRDASTIIGKCCRGAVVRKQNAKELRGVLLIQRLLRGMLHRLYFKKIKMEHTKRLLDREFNAACRIQKVSFRFLFRIRRLHTASAILIQKIVRGKLARKIATDEKLLIEKLREVAHNSSEEVIRIQNCAAITLQKRVRGNIIRTKLTYDRQNAKEMKAATLLQSFVRGWTGRRYVTALFLKKKYRLHSRLHHFDVIKKPTVRELIELNASGSNQNSMPKTGPGINKYKCLLAKRELTPCQVWWIGIEINEEGQLITPRETEDDSRDIGDRVITFANVHSYDKKTRLLRVLFFDYIYECEIELLVPYDQPGVLWCHDRDVEQVRVEPVDLYPSRRPSIDDCIGYYVYGGCTMDSGKLCGLASKLSQHASVVTIHSDENLDDLVLLKVSNTRKKLKQIVVSDFDLQEASSNQNNVSDSGTIAKDLREVAMNEEDMEILPFDSPELLWYTTDRSLVVKARCTAERFEGKLLNSRTHLCSELIPVTPPKFSTEKSSSQLSKVKPPLSSAVGWKVLVEIGEEDQPADSEVAEGIVVGVDVSKKVMQVLFDVDDSTTSCFESDTETIPYDSREIQWFAPGMRNPIKVIHDERGLDGVSDANSCSSNLRRANDVLLFFSAQIQDLLGAYGVNLPIDSDEDVVAFEILRVRPLINETVGCFVKLVSEERSENCGVEDNVCGFVIGFDEKKKLLLVRFADFSAISPEKPLSARLSAKVTTCISTMLRLVAPTNCEDDSEVVDELPFSSQGMLLYKFKPLAL